MTTPQSKAKYTPGPWCITGDYQRPSGHILYNIAGSPNEDFQANAALISSAPELAEALKDIMDFVLHEYGYGKVHKIKALIYTAKAEAALRKAGVL